MPGGKKLIKLPDGRVVEVDESFDDILAWQGATEETAQERVGRLIHEASEARFGSGAGQAAAGVAGFMRGATLGLSDPLAVELGAATPEELRGFEEANPTTSTVSEIAGMIVPSVLAPGAGTPGAGVGRAILGGTPAGLAARIGPGIAARGAGKGLAKKTAASAAGYGLEGSVFSTGQYISDVAMEKKELSAEAFVGSLGHGALWGGGLGAAFPVVGGAFGAARGRLQSAAPASGPLRGARIPTAKTIKDTLPPGRLAGAADKTIKDTIPAGRLGKIDQTVQLKKLIPKRQRTPSAVKRLRVKYVVEGEKQLLRGRDLIEQADDLVRSGAAPDARLANRLAEFKAARARAEELITQIGKKEAPAGPATAQWEGRIHDLADEISGQGIMAQTDVGALRRFARQHGHQVADRRRAAMAAKSAGDDPQLAARGAFGGQTPEGEVGEVVEAARGVLKQGYRAQRPRTIVDEIQVIGDYERTQLEVFQAVRKHMDPVAAARMDDEFKTAVDAVKRQESRGGFESLQDVAGAAEVLQSLGVPGMPDVDQLPVVGPLLGAYLKWRGGKFALQRLGVVGSPVATTAARGVKIRDRVSGAVEKFLSSAEKAGSKSKAAMVPTATVLSHALFESETPRKRVPKGDAEPSSAEQQRLYQARLDELGRAAADPDSIRRSVRQRVNAGDPDVQKEIEETVTRQIEFLHGKAPTDPRPQHPLGIERAWNPSPSDLSKFAAYARAATDPASVLEDMAAGRLSLEAVETLKAVYPSMYADVQEEIVDRIAELRRDLSYGQRVQLSILFDIPVDDSMQPEFILAMQQGYAKEAPEPPAPTLKAATNLSEQETLAAHRRAAR